MKTNAVSSLMFSYERVDACPELEEFLQCVFISCELKVAYQLRSIHHVCKLKER